MAKLAASLFQPAFDVFATILPAVISIIIRQIAPPFQRGFFCDDQSLQHPYKSSTVSVTVLYSLGFLIPITTVLIVEFLILINKKIVKGPNYKKTLLTRWLQMSFQILIFFLFGMAFTHLSTNIAKYTLGRLRPHFLTVCQPDYSLFNCSSGFIVHDVCTGNPARIKEARVSFPSGHASAITYTMIFTLLYLELRFTWRNLQLLRPILQAMLFCIAYYICMTRISDYKHHWSDVLGGVVLGLIMDIIMIYKVHKLLEDNEKSKDKYHDNQSELSGNEVSSKAPTSQISSL